MLYVPLENNDDTDDGYESIPFFDFKETITYKYMVYSFQFVDRNMNSYASRNTYRCFLLFRIISMLAMLVCFGVDIVFFVRYYQQEKLRLSFVSKIFTILVKVLWMTRHVVLFGVGIYLFNKHQNPITRMIDKLQYPSKKSYEKSEKLKSRLIKIDKKMNQIIGWNLFMLVLIPLLVKLAPIVIEMFVKQMYKWNSWELELFEMLSILYTRVAPLPFYFFLIYCGFIQRLQIKQYYESIKCKSYKGTLDDAFQEYVCLHQDISDHSKKYKFYIKTCLLYTSPSPRDS